jgi:hypothetical protein
MSAMEISDADIELVARAICAAHGFDPDEKTRDEEAGPLSKDRYVPRWLLLRTQAITHIAAFRAISGRGDR